MAIGAAPQSVNASNAEANPSSTAIAAPGSSAPTMNRGAATAACASAPARRRSRSWAWIWGWAWPPIVPATQRTRPSRSTTRGISVCSGRLPGAGAFGLSGSAEKQAPRLWQRMPVRRLEHA